jgi:prepilin-type N-terminal cleavage/methylation domain-containing protein
VKKFKRDVKGFSLIELAMTVILTCIIFSAVYVFHAGHQVQSNQISDYIDIQRDARLVLAQLRKDVLELVNITKGERNEDQTMTSLEFEVPADINSMTPVKYEFDTGTRTLRRNGHILIRDEIRDVKIWFLDKDGHDVFEANTFDNTFALRFRITIATARQKEKEDNSPTPPTPDEKKMYQRERVIDFSVYPRTPVSRIKAKEGKLNLTTGRFAVSRSSGGRLSATPDDTN